jgi:hypothetical protein
MIFHIENRQNCYPLEEGKWVLINTNQIIQNVFLLCLKNLLLFSTFHLSWIHICFIYDVSRYYKQYDIATANIQHFFELGKESVNL